MVDGAVLVLRLTVEVVCTVVPGVVVLGAAELLGVVVVMIGVGIVVGGITVVVSGGCEEVVMRTVVVGMLVVC